MERPVQRQIHPTTPMKYARLLKAVLRFPASKGLLAELPSKA